MNQSRYRKIWVDDDGSKYRKDTVARQAKYGTMPLASNPSFQEVRDALRSHSPKTVLEVGCGWGRILEHLADEFDVVGCDISPDLLKLVPSHIPTFSADITIPCPVRVDVAFVRGVLLYLTDDELALASENLMMIAKTTIVWEPEYICAKPALQNRSFELRPIEIKNE